MHMKMKWFVLDDDTTHGRLSYSASDEPHILVIPTSQNENCGVTSIVTIPKRQSPSYQ